MVNYNNGKIYKIEPISGGEEGDVYIGSTSKPRLCDRMSSHRSGYKNWKISGKSKYTSYDLFDKYGVENCQIHLLETVSCNTKDELLAREGFYIKSMPCVNKTIVTRTAREYVKDRMTDNDYVENQKKYQGEYRKNNKTKSKEYNEKYHSREDVKERRRERRRERERMKA